jgi:hypothetical protein
MLVACACLAGCVGGAPAARAASASLSFEIADATGWRGDKAAAVAPGVTETYAYDAAGDTVTVSVKFDKADFAPLPPLLALALEYGFPARLERKPVETGHVSVLVPLTGFENSDGYAWTVQGLGKYVFAEPVLGDGQVPEALRKALDAEVDKLLEAGPLAPWLVLVNVPGSGTVDRGEVCWQNPAETLYLLAEVAPVLSAERQAKLKEYLKAARTNAPPEKTKSIGLGKGVPREVTPHDANVLARWAKQNAYETQGPVPIWSLYGLARYGQLTGEKLDPAAWAACGEIVRQGLEHRDWATLYWRRGHTPHFNAVHGVNQLFAGFVGYIRLARAAGDAQAEALGFGMLARLAALRFAMGKYTQFMHDHGFFSPRYFGVHNDPGDGTRKGAPPALQREADPQKAALPSDPAWWVKLRAGSWMGDLVTWNWSQPIHNVRQVHRLDETGVDVWEWCGVDNSGTGQKRDSDIRKNYWYMCLSPYYLPFRDLTPELGRFLGEHLKPESAAFCQRVVENQPHWYAAYSEAILGAEYGFMSPCNAYSLFAAHAWVLSAPPGDLYRCADVPWLRMGDLFYLHKLAETSKAYRGVKWSR